MKLSSLALSILFMLGGSSLLSQQTRFEKTNGKESATYNEAINFYKQLSKISPLVSVKTMGTTDAGFPLHLVLVNANANFSINQWDRKKNVVLLINNGIHPGEPDGIDASMLLVRDIVAKKIIVPKNIFLAFIPVYNIGGCLNRGGATRVNQNGPLDYGFRGNSQNLDLNRDFTKSDSREAKSFAQIFHLLDPDILIDNHVSDGADYQPTITLLTTQYNKLGERLGDWLKNTFEPQLYADMRKKGNDMIPYVNFESAQPEIGMEMFYDPPRYSSGYAALFQTIAFMPETHMLKPFKDRVLCTYALLQTMMEKASVNAASIIQERKIARDAVKAANSFALGWKSDSSHYSLVRYSGYEQAFKISSATGLQKMFYDHQLPFTKNVKLFDVFLPYKIINKPTAYIIPVGWNAVIDLLRLNGVRLQQLKKDTLMEVELYHIVDYKSSLQPYEKHHRNSQVKTMVSKKMIQFHQGDWYIPMNQITNRYIAEMLEPQGDDSFFAWNFFDAILQQKEGYSDYRWEDVAGEILKNDSALQQKLIIKKQADLNFANNAHAQLDFIFKNSPYYEKAHLLYPVYRLIQ